MSTSVVLPPLGDSVTEGTVTRWLKSVGDTITVDEGLLEISTDKVDTEIPSPVGGVLEEILVQEDETVEVGAVLARIGDGQAASATDAGDDSANQSDAAPADAAAAPELVAPPESVAAPEPAAAEAPAPDSTGDHGKDVLLPELGDSVTEGTVTRWLKSVGDDVHTDEPLLEISTDKVDTEIPSPFTGILQAILVQEDETVAVGTVLGRIGDAGVEEVPAAPAPAPAAAATAPAAPTVATPAPPAPVHAAPAPAAPVAQPAPSVAAPAASGVVEDELTYVTPLVRRLAQQQGVDLGDVKGTGVGGRIRKEDVLKAALAAQTPAPASVPSAAPSVEPSALRGTTVPMSRLRKVLAESAVASMQQSAQLACAIEVDVTRLAALRERVRQDFQAETGQKLTFLPFFTLAAARALQAHPVINAAMEGENIVYPAVENVSIAVDTERGLLTPVLREAGTQNVAGLAAEIADLAARARENRLTPDELSGGTFTVTNAGSRGVLFDIPEVFLPQAANLSVGAVVKRPGVVDVDGKDAIAIRSYAYLTLSYDHRIIDGAEAAQFLQTMAAQLEAGEFEADLGI